MNLSAADKLGSSGAATSEDGDVGERVLEVEHLVKHFPIRKGVFGRRVGEVHAVDDISFELYKGQTLGLVGESGCGKTTAGRTMMRLLEPTSGAIRLLGHEIATTTDLRALARDMAFVFQDPFSSLNPRLTAAKNVTEPLRIQGLGNTTTRRARAAELFSQVGLREDQLDRLPAEFSGGQRQRIGIARALALSPKVVILDEPVSALDVSVQAQVLNLLRRLQIESQVAFLFISHDLSVVRHLCNRVAVMYLGKVVEIGAREQIYDHALHPYTQALLSAVPVPEPGARRDRIVLQGDLPSPVNPPSGCRFRTRCWKAQDICAEKEPELISRTGAQPVACHFPEEIGAGKLRAQA